VTLPGVHFAEAAWLWALLAVPVAAGLLLWSAWRRRGAARVFAGATASPQLGAASRAARIARAVTVLLALALLPLALARPQWNPREEEVSVKGRDVVFLVDVSRSMLATDVSPSRLGRAKLWINDVANSVKGDRVALVAFAGASSIKCPLTLDYGYFRMALDELSPASVPRGGTLIGDAIRKTLSQVFDGTEGRGRDIILITDGEDQESFPVQAAEQAAKQGVRIIAIGIGSESGSLVPGEGNSVVTYGGERVRSKMDPAGLSQIAGASKGGVFFNVGVGTIDLERVYQDLIASAEKSELAKQTTVRYEEKFQLFLAVAVGLLMLEVLLRAS
jgi:Ca-activated chloride channel family protein